MQTYLLEEKQFLSSFASEIRKMSRRALISSRSGHAGLPFGAAELGAYLFGKFLHLSPNNPNWMGRDRFVLSAGHGVLLLYTALHLIGYDLSEEDIQKYRRFGSKTPSHPDIRKTTGIEATTGCDGQGIGYGVGLALGMKINQERFDKPELSLFNMKCIVLGSDGCFMEGVSSECSSLAGHLNLNNLIVIYDSNKTCLDGYTFETFSEDIKLRYQAYGWDVFELSGYNFRGMDEIFTSLRDHQKKPALIIAHTITGKGITEIEGTPSAHGNPLKELAKIKKECPTHDRFNRDLAVHRLELAKLESNWNQKYDVWGTKYPHLKKEFLYSVNRKIPKDIEQKLSSISFPNNISGRLASQRIINILAEEIPDLYGGSADLSRSDKTYLNKYRSISFANFSGRNIKYGVREFGMCTIAIGMALTRLIRPFIGTYLCFSNYMMSAIRMSALMKQKVIFQLTHDSFLIGEDGPTHQPVEHIAQLRAIPNLLTIRPADSNEVKMAWIAALSHDGPVAILLSRQELPLLLGTDCSYANGFGKGGYILEGSKHNVDFLFVATGSEVFLAKRVIKCLHKMGFSTRLVSMPCQELFDQQQEKYKRQVLGNAKKSISVEAGVSQGWHQYIGKNGVAISIDNFGESGSPKELCDYYKFTENDILKRIGVW